MRAAERFEAGVTLVELLVVVAILAILAGLGAASVTDGKDIQQVAKQTQNSFREASRIAAASGPVPAPVLAAGETAQVRIHIWGDNTTGNQYVGIEKFTDPGGGFTWGLVNSFSVRGDFEIVGYRTSAEISGGAGPEVVLGPSGQVTIDCNARGACSPSTIYLRDTDRGDEVRVVTMPLHGAPRVFGGF